MNRVSNMVAISLCALCAILWSASMLFSIFKTPPALVRPDSPDQVVNPPSSDTLLPPALARRRFGFAMRVEAAQDIQNYLDAVDSIAGIGADSLLIVTPLYQDDASSTTIQRDPERCPTIAQLEAVIDRAAKRNLAVALMPVVLLRNPGTNQWRGRLAPDDWSMWWDSYEIQIMRMADLAQASGVSLFFVGSELNSTEEMDARWRDLIAGVRARFAGELSYSANWDRFPKVRFWHGLDAISVSAWFTISDSDQPTDEELAQSWQKIFDRLLAASEHWQRPFLLSEIGYPCLPWALSQPWNYVPGSQTRPDTAAQQRGYQAFFDALGQGLEEDPRFHGFFCYEWDPNHPQPEQDFGYSLHGKPAYDTVRDWFHTRRQSPKPSS